MTQMKQVIRGREADGEPGGMAGVADAEREAVEGGCVCDGESNADH